MGSTIGNVQRPRDRLGRYKSSTTGIKKPEVRGRKGGQVGHTAKIVLILKSFLEVFFLSDSNGRNFVPANCRHGPLRRLYESILRPEYIVTTEKFAEVVRSWEDESGRSSREIDRRYVSERSGECRKQIAVYQGRRMPNPNIAPERSSVEQFLQDRSEDQSLKWDTVADAVEAVTSTLDCYGTIEGTDEMGYHGYPTKRVKRKKNRNPGSSTGSPRAVRNGPVQSSGVGNDRSGDVAPQDTDDACGTVETGKTSPEGGFIRKSASSLPHAETQTQARTEGESVVSGRYGLEAMPHNSNDSLTNRRGVDDSPGIYGPKRVANEGDKAECASINEGERSAEHVIFGPNVATEENQYDHLTVTAPSQSRHDDATLARSVGPGIAGEGGTRENVEGGTRENVEAVEAGHTDEIAGESVEVGFQTPNDLLYTKPLEQRPPGPLLQGTHFCDTEVDAELRMPPLPPQHIRLDEVDNKFWDVTRPPRYISDSLSRGNCQVAQDILSHFTGTSPRKQSAGDQTEGSDDSANLDCTDMHSRITTA